MGKLATTIMDNRGAAWYNSLSPDERACIKAELKQKLTETIENFWRQKMWDDEDAKVMVSGNGVPPPKYNVRLSLEKLVGEGE